MKKKGDAVLSLRLVENPDILAEVLRRRKAVQVVMGFAAETDDLEKNARAKWKKKPCDLLVANRVGGKDSAFENDSNELLVFSRKRSTPLLVHRDLKSRLAEKLLDLAGEFSNESV